MMGSAAASSSSVLVISAVLFSDRGGNLEDSSLSSTGGGGGCDWVSDEELAAHMLFICCYDSCRISFLWGVMGAKGKYNKQQQTRMVFVGFERNELPLASFDKDSHHPHE